MGVKELWRENISRGVHTEVCVRFNYDMGLYGKKRSCEIREDGRMNDSGLLY